MKQYSIIIPVYSGEHTVRPLFKELKSYFDKTEYSYEVIFVYDCGKDNSWNVLKELKDEHSEIIKLIKLSRNYGQHNAIICGFEYATGDFIITMDEDLQHLPCDIEKLIEERKKEDYDVVYGKYEELKHGIFRNLTSSLFRVMLKKGIPELCMDYSAFRLIKKDIAKATIDLRNSYTFIDGYLSWVTQDFSSCIVSHQERFAGKSAYTTSKLMEHSINIFVTFSNYPIRLLTKTSVLLFLLSLLYAIYVLINKFLYNNYLAGYATYVIVMGMGVALILLALGILGEYIYRINLKTTKRPNYNIKSSIL